MAWEGRQMAHQGSREADAYLKGTRCPPLPLAKRRVILCCNEIRQAVGVALTFLHQERGWKNGAEDLEWSLFRMGTGKHWPDGPNWQNMVGLALEHRAALCGVAAGRPGPCHLRVHLKGTGKAGTCGCRSPREMTCSCWSWPRRNIWKKMNLYSHSLITLPVR